MIKISHRGNLIGPNPEMENKPEYIERAIEAGFDCEIDIWCWPSFIPQYFLGHDSPEYTISLDWLNKFKNKLWLHCKMLQALESKDLIDFNRFYHENDLFTLTSKGFIWRKPIEDPNEEWYTNNCVVVHNTAIYKLSNAKGVCSDYISLYE